MKKSVLVTGGTGFLGTQMILQLLQKGYNVKTTVRSLKSKDKVLETLGANGITTLDKLTFVEADLSKDDNWKDAMRGCEYVLSVASPVFFTIPKNEEEMIRPAVEGIIRVLKAARDAGVKRVIMTSNFGAVGFSNQDLSTVTTEENWTNPDEKGLSVYEKSKLLAEKAAWDFVKTQGGELEFATINPVAILGPSLSSHISGSFVIVENILNGSMKSIPNIPLNIVDVRDVADLHIRAMETPSANGERFIASADGQISMPEMAALLRSKRPRLATKVSTKTMPNWLLRFAALFNREAREGSLLLRMNRNVSNEKAKEMLGWEPIGTNEETILATVDNMVVHGIIGE
ncbi:SDR family oxidoreductase [Listeria rustica]|uniref:Aldehyde reductase n=1 Tax=Listeria rustica TaxID=2713503 RepID=A0A7W1YFY5_9LIST|nr:aldehyde reductase [Listeria rustica]MBA3926132.1 aldehyde reductase [Listeria rustica]